MGGGTAPADMGISWTGTDASVVDSGMDKAGSVGCDGSDEKFGIGIFRREETRWMAGCGFCSSVAPPCGVGCMIFTDSYGGMTGVDTQFPIVYSLVISNVLYRMRFAHHCTKLKPTIFDILILFLGQFIIQSYDKMNIFFFLIIGVGLTSVAAFTDFKPDIRYNATLLKHDVIPSVSHLFPSIHTDVLSHATQAEQFHLNPIKATVALSTQRQTPHFSWMDAKFALSINRLSHCSVDQIQTFACRDCDEMKLKFVYQPPSVDAGKVIITTTETFILVGFHGSAKPIPTWLSQLTTTQLKFPCIRCKVHAGFYHQFTELVDTTVDALTELHDQDPSLPIYITGHSSGAALATLMSVYVSIFSPSLPISHVFTFGSPRVGNLAFAALANKMLGERWFRIVNQLDVVSSVPALSFGYHHIGQLMICNTGTTVCSIKGRNQDNEGGAQEDLLRLTESTKDIQQCHFTYWKEDIQCTIKN